MQTFQAGKDITVVVPMKDDAGNDITVAAVAWRLSGVTGPLTNWADLTSYIAESPEAEIVVPAASNALATGEPRALRIVELQLSQAVTGNVIQQESAYAIQDGSVLVEGVNSFQSLASAEFEAMTIPNIDAFNSASTDRKIAALVDARLHISQLDFTPLTDNRFWGQNSLSFVPEGQFQTNYVQRDRAFLFNGNIAWLTPDQFSKLPEQFLAALRRAQVAEANAILGGDPVEELRRAGVTLNTVGESKMMFRPSMPLQLPVCRRALGYLGMFVSFSKRIGRT